MTEEPITDFPRSPLETWTTETGIPCKIQAGFAGIFGYVQLPEIVRVHLKPGTALEEGLLAALGLDEGPDEEGWVCSCDHQADQIWPEDVLRLHLPPDGFQRAMSVSAPLRDAGYPVNFGIDQLRESTTRLARRVAELADRIAKDAA